MNVLCENECPWSKIRGFAAYFRHGIVTVVKVFDDWQCGNVTSRFRQSLTPNCDY